MALHFLSLRLFFWSSWIIRYRKSNIVIYNYHKESWDWHFKLQTSCKAELWEKKNDNSQFNSNKKGSKKAFFLKYNDCLFSCRVYEFYLQSIGYCQNYKAWFKQFFVHCFQYIYKYIYIGIYYLLYVYLNLKSPFS